MTEPTPWPPTSEQSTTLVQEDKPWSYKGRFGRLSYLAWSFVNVVVALLLCIPIFGITMSVGGSQGIAKALLCVLLIIMGIVAVIFTIRRLHDFNRSGWWAILAFIPYVSVVFCFIVTLVSGNKEANRFGPVRITKLWEKVCGWLYVIGIPLLGIAAAIAIPAYQSYVIKAQQASIQQQAQYSPADNIHINQTSK